MAVLPLTLLISAALFIAATALAVVIAVRALREQRVTIFPLVREAEGIKAKRAGLAGGLFLVLAAVTLGGWVATQQNPENVLVAREATRQASIAKQTQPTATLRNNISRRDQILPTAAPTSVSTAPLSPTATITLPAPQIAGSTAIITPEPTINPTPLPAPTNLPATAEAVSAPPGISLGPISFALDVTDRREAIDPTAVFDNRTDRIYAVFHYRGMKNGLPFSIVWYYQNQEIARDEYEWKWGNTDNSFAYIKPVGPGTYRVELKVGDTVLATNSFEITP